MMQNVKDDRQPCIIEANICLDNKKRENIPSQAEYTLKVVF